MPHQDDAYLRQNVATIKALLGQILPEEINTFSRHGNSQRDASWLASVAIVCLGFTNRGTLSDRVRTACSVVGLLRGDAATITRQGLFQALATSGQALIEIIIAHIAEALPSLKGHWTRGGKVNIAVDGSKVAAPRSEANQEFFSASASPSKPVAGRRKKRRQSQRKRRSRPKGKAARSKDYHSEADQSKASTVQVLMVVFWHITTGLPLRWRLHGHGGSERVSAQEQIRQLPSNARLIADAEYVGYPLWSTIINSRRSFLVRVGSNVTLLKGIGKYRIDGPHVWLWPDQVRKEGEPPLHLRLITLHDGRKPVYLVTSELDMPQKLASKLYAERWGVEVFFRTVKQTCERSKLHCRTPQNALTELNWTLLGVWVAVFHCKQTLAAMGEPIETISPVKVIRAFDEIVLILDLSTRRTPLLHELLSVAVKADESHRTSSKASRNYPRKKQHSSAGPPKIQRATREQKLAAKEHGY